MFVLRLEHFRAAPVTTLDVNRYIAARQAAGAANATVNRELAALKRAYSIGCKAAKILVRPHIPMLSENNVRTGFFERDQFESVRVHLPPGLRGVVTFAYMTGWRVPRARSSRCGGIKSISKRVLYALSL